MGTFLAVVALMASLYGQINNWRVSHGTDPLPIHPGSHAAAQEWAHHLADTQQLVHAEDLSPGIAPGWARLGENVGHSIPQPGQSALIYRAFTLSPAHNAVLLRPDWDGFGIGIAFDSDGGLWVVLRFIDEGN